MDAVCIYDDRVAVLTTPAHNAMIDSAAWLAMGSPLHSACLRSPRSCRSWRRSTCHEQIMERTSRTRFSVVECRICAARQEFFAFSYEKGMPPDNNIIKRQRYAL